MNWDQLEGKWKQLRGKVRARWGKLTDSDLSRMSGKREELAGILQEKYGYTKERVEEELDEFMDAESKSKAS